MNAPAPAAAAPKNDFADWLSPILVKELRQGLRTRVFTSTFILLQVVMTACVFIGLLVAANGGNTSGSTGFFWTFVSLPLLLVLPWSGLGAVAGEVRANTLDLIFLTRLSAWRILVGKWVAIVAQAALLLSAVLPYVVLRYFMGGVNLSGELLGLAGLFAISALLSAIFVGLSAYPGRLMRILVVIALVFGAWTVLPMIVFAIMSPVMTGGGLPALGTGAVVVLVALMLVFAALALDFGASRIAPVAENHSVRKRLLGLLILALAAVAAAGVPNSQVVAIVALIAVVPTLVGALVEEPVAILSVYQPFARRGFFGRLLGRLFYPGWPSGMLYTVGVLAGFAGVLALQGLLDTGWGVLGYLAFGGSLFVPAALLRLAVRPPRRMLALFIGVQTIALAGAAGLRIIDNVTESHAAELLAVFPPSMLLVVGTGGVREGSLELATVVTAAVTLLATLVLLILAARSFRQISAWERASLEEPVRDDKVA